MLQKMEPTQDMHQQCVCDLEVYLGKYVSTGYRLYRTEPLSLIESCLMV